MRTVEEIKDEIDRLRKLRNIDCDREVNALEWVLDGQPSEKPKPPAIGVMSEASTRSRPLERRVAKSKPKGKLVTKSAAARRSTSKAARLVVVAERLPDYLL
jgi:hypothetical protein